MSEKTLNEAIKYARLQPHTDSTVGCTDSESTAREGIIKTSRERERGRERDREKERQRDRASESERGKDSVSIV